MTQPDLFMTTPAAPVGQQASEPDRPPDFWSMYARETYGLPDGWRWIRIEAKDGKPGQRLSELFGAVPDGVVYKSGPRKGQLNLKRRHDERTFIIDMADLEKFERRWELSTGNCSECGGGGQTLNGWNRETGAKYGACARCGGNGKARP